MAQHVDARDAVQAIFDLACHDDVNITIDTVIGLDGMPEFHVCATDKRNRNSSTADSENAEDALYVAADGLRRMLEQK